MSGFRGGQIPPGSSYVFSGATDWRISDETMALADKVGEQVTGMYLSLAAKVAAAEAEGYEPVPESLRMVDESNPAKNEWKMSLTIDMRKKAPE